MVVVAEGTGADAALTAGFCVASSSLGVSVKRRGRWTGAVVISAAPAGVSVWLPVTFVGANTSSAALAVNSGARAGAPIWQPAPFIAAGTISAPVAVKCAALAVNSSALASPSVIIVPVIKGVASGVVRVVVINYGAVMPIRSPMMPAPSISSVEADSEADPERQVRSAIPDSGIRVPSWPRHYGSSVNQPRIIRGDVNDFGASGLNDDGRVLRRYGLLRGSLQIARFLRPLAHYLYGVHHILLLVVVGVAQRRRPGQVFVHIAKYGWKRSERLDAWVPGLLVHSLTQSVALQIRMRLHPAVGLDDLLGK